MSADRLHGNLRRPQSLNRYSYVANDPLNFIDPLGLELVEVCVWTVTGSQHDTFNGEDRETRLYWGFLCQQVDILSGGGGAVGDPLGSGLGDGGVQDNRIPKVNLQALIDCLFKQFRVVLTSFVPSQTGGQDNPNANGSFTGVGPDVLNGDPAQDPPFFSSITVANDAQSRSTGSLTDQADADGSRNPGDPPARGFTPRLEPYTNFTANDLLNPQSALQIQIFELGNSLDRITGFYSVFDKSQNEKHAEALLNCYNNGGPN